MTTKPLPTADLVRGRAAELDVPVRSVTLPVLDEHVTATVRVFDAMGKVLRTYAEPPLCLVDRFGQLVRLRLSAEETETLPVGTMFYDVLLHRARDNTSDVPGSGFWKVRDTPPVEPPAPSFAHHVMVNHDWGETDALRCMTPWGSPVPDVVVQLYLRADYEVGRYHLLGTTRTREDGRWLAAVPLLPGYDYVVHLAKSGEAGPDIVHITV